MYVNEGTNLEIINKLLNGLLPRDPHYIVKDLIPKPSILNYEKLWESGNFITENGGKSFTK